MDINKIIKNYESATQERDGFRSMLTDVYQYCIPSRNSWTTQSQGARNDIVIYNSHPVVATKNFASNVLNLIAPSGLKFFSLVSNKQLKDDAQEEFNKQVAPISDMIFDYIDRSNFYIASHEAMIDLGAGTGGMLCKYSGDDSNPLSFTSLDMSALCFSESSNGIVNNVYCDVTDLSHDMAVACYPDAEFPSNEDKLSFLVATVYDEDMKNFHYMIINKENKDVYLDTVYATNPFIVFRWNKLANETHGRGVLTDMLGTIKTANLMMADILTASQKVIAPPMLVYSNSIINPSNTDFSPNSIISVKPIQGVVNPISSLPFTGNLPFGIQQVQEFNRQLDEALLINILGGVGQSQQTATEVSARMQLAANVLGSVYGRLQREMLAPAINHSIEILTKRGLIPKLDGIKITYQSPITHMQLQHDYQKFMQAVQSIAQISGNNAQQAIMTSIEVAKLPTWIAEHLGADMSLFRTTAEVQASMEMQQKIAQQRQSMQQMLSNPALGTRPVDTGIQVVRPI